MENNNNELKDFLNKTAQAINQKAMLNREKVNEILESTEDAVETSQLQGWADGPGACPSSFHMETCSDTVKKGSSCLFGADYCSALNCEYTQPGGCWNTSVQNDKVENALRSVGGREYFDLLESRYKQYLKWAGRHKPIAFWDD